MIKELTVFLVSASVSTLSLEFKHIFESIYKLQSGLAESTSQWCIELQVWH